MAHPNSNESNPRSSSNSCFLIGFVTILVFVLCCMFWDLNSKTNNANSRIQSVNNVKNIVLGLRAYSSENDGFYINFDDSEFTSSQDAFNILIPDIINTEQTFWMKNNEPNHRNPPVEDGVLTKGECIYGYVSGLTEDSSTSSPLVFEGFLNKKDFSSTKYSLLPKPGKIIVGYVDGHVEQNSLTTRKVGGTAQSADRKIDNIFLPIDAGGYLDTSPKNVLFPIGWE